MPVLVRLLDHSDFHIAGGKLWKGYQLCNDWAENRKRSQAAEIGPNHLRQLAKGEGAGWGCHLHRGQQR